MAWSLIGNIGGPQGPAGGPGDDGREVEIRNDGTHVQWRYVGDPSWTDIVALSALTGPAGADGDPGDPGPDGSPGADGREVELQKSATHVQWRYVGTVSWTDLVALSDITGPAGTDGADGSDGAPGDPGADGADGVDGRGITSITRTSGTGAAGTTDTYTITYSDATTSTFTVVNGANGAAGSAGPAGTDGKTVLSGSGAPSGGTGVDGDFYIRTSDNTIYGPKTSGAWGSPTSLVGPTGATGSAGSTGAAGADGKTVLNGSGAPSGGTGANGDFYINTAANTIYGPKTAGAWGSPTSLVGPTGATGAAGSNASVGTDAIWDAKGDLAVGSGADAGGKLAVGSNGKVPTADSTQTLGIKWAWPYPPGSLDAPPDSPNAKDDEFDGTSSVSWSNTPTAASATSINGSTSPGQLLITSSGTAFQGLMQAVPGSYPYTITACLSDTDLQGSADRGGGLILGPASPTGSSNMVYIGDANLVRFAGVYTFNGAFGSVAGVQPTRSGRMYVRIRVNSATSIDSWINHMGSGWVARHSAFNPGFTPGVMGLAASRGTGGAGSSSFFDWFRVT